MKIAIEEPQASSAQSTVVSAGPDCSVTALLRAHGLLRPLCPPGMSGTEQEVHPQALNNYAGGGYINHTHPRKIVNTFLLLKLFAFSKEEPIDTKGSQNGRISRNMANFTLNKRKMKELK